MSKSKTIIEAHTQIETLTFEYNYPAHEPRESDPHYHIFNETRARLVRLGKLTCWIGNADCRGGIQLHHDLEFSFAGLVDSEKFSQCFPEFHIRNDDDFGAWIEGEGNLTPLCQMHHTGILGIHVIHYPAWKIQRYMREGVLPPERKVMPVKTSIRARAVKTVVTQTATETTVTQTATVVQAEGESSK